MASGELLDLRSAKKRELIAELRDKDYREGFVEAHVGDSIAFQLKAMRMSKGMDQRDVAGLLGNPKLQPMVSRYENPDYGKYSVSTLLELAKAFDVALVVRFAPFSELLDWDLDVSAGKLCPKSFVEDFKQDAIEGVTHMLTETPSVNTLVSVECTNAYQRDITVEETEAPVIQQKQINEIQYLSA